VGRHFQPQVVVSPVAQGICTHAAPAPHAAEEEHVAEQIPSMQPDF
jgi:hypothetical protein